MKFKNILFDLDGTLTDPKVGITKSVAHALKYFGKDATDLDSLCKFIGPPLAYSFANYYGFDDMQCEKAIKVYREYFSVKGLFENEVYDGVPELLSTLKENGYRLFIATSKPERFAREILEHFSLSQYFEDIKGIAMNEEKVEKPEIVRRVIDGHGLKKSECIMVGDRCYDIIGAKENGIASIGVLYGYGNREELLENGADFIADDINKLREILI